ncbi:MAG: histidine phosphatase family protein [Oscillospiraceae bacterium]|nr:histidine phosphatase family protein [Oscillospiraceae bacterium]
MLIYLLRHGATLWNPERRYQGLTDLPLSQRGRSVLRPAEFSPKRVYVSPLCRAVQTAAILFPGAEQIPVPGLCEMDFGAFEGRTANEMEQDPDYLAWVEGGCTGRCPGGEGWAEFSERTSAAFDQLMENAPDPLVIVAHGGTQMAVLERYGRPSRPRWSWLCRNGGGFLLECGDWQKKRELTLLREVYWGE